MGGSTTDSTNTTFRWGWGGGVVNGGRGVRAERCATVHLQ